VFDRMSVIRLQTGVHIVGNEKKFEDPIHMTVKLQGSPDRIWTHAEKENPK